jgi:hypothetical protein
MKTTLKLAAALLPLFTAGYALAADDAAAPQMPVVSVQVVTTEDPSGYATWIAKANENFKAAGGPEHYTHVYEAVIAGEETGNLFAVRFADSNAALAKNSEALEKLPERSELMGHFSAMRKLGASTLLKAVHYEGGSSGEWLYITDAQVNDEAAYIKAIGELRTLLDSHDLKDIKLNVFRVLAGRSNHSDEVVISAPSHDRIAAFMDSMTAPWVSDWLAGLAPIRTVVHNGIYREISK